MDETDFREIEDWYYLLRMYMTYNDLVRDRRLPGPLRKQAFEVLERASRMCLEVQHGYADPTESANQLRGLDQEFARQLHGESLRGFEATKGFHLSYKRFIRLLQQAMAVARKMLSSGVAVTSEDMCVQMALSLCRHVLEDDKELTVLASGLKYRLERLEQEIRALVGQQTGGPDAGEKENGGAMPTDGD
jgi:hypothetical protein